MSDLSWSDRITAIVLLNPYNERNFIMDKLSVVDVKARQANDEHISSIAIDRSSENSDLANAWGYALNENQKFMEIPFSSSCLD